MKRLDTPKRVFTFTLGEYPQIYTVEDIPTLSSEDQQRINSIYQNWLEGQKPYERDWRNYELTNTDWMVSVSDATYDGMTLAGTSRLEEIFNYRKALRDYNLTTDDRPVRPIWFKG